ncbi:MAG: hypothetical protein ACI4SR_08940 [Faecalibacillus sp.]
MLKKLLSILSIVALTFSITGCSFFEDEKSNGGSSNKTSIDIKTVDDFQESEGLIKYFTIEDFKFALPETVGEYANYLEQLGTVTLNETGNSVYDEEINAGGISSMAAYLTVETDEGEKARFYVRYKNDTDDDLSVAEAKVTYIEVKYDALSEMDYDRVFTDIKVVTSDYTFELNDKKGFKRFFNELGDPIKNIDGRLDYSDNLGYTYTFDCCNENRNGVFRGFIVKYPEK